ncbi:MAG: hypothetical protein PHX61_02715 [Alphaproteobacteria bacterium]|nr:hypothetical protein [Alphaproteobacteria bacterium]
MTYKINYTISFVIFWGLALGFGLFAGGLLTFALVAMMILVLISHENAHLKQCLKRGVKVNSVTFTAMGGMVDADILYANDAVPILAAGVIDTGFYTFVFGGFLAALYLIRPHNFNFAMNPWLNLLTSTSASLVVMFITNILPITYHSKKDGIISTDGWGAVRYSELRDELWNDGRCLAGMDR